VTMSYNSSAKKLIWRLWKSPFRHVYEDAADADSWGTPMRAMLSAIFNSVFIALLAACLLATPENNQNFMLALMCGILLGCGILVVFLVVVTVACCNCACTCAQLHVALSVVATILADLLFALSTGEPLSMSSVVFLSHFVYTCLLTLYNLYGCGADTVKYGTPECLIFQMNGGGDKSILLPGVFVPGTSSPSMYFQCLEELVWHRNEVPIGWAMVLSGTIFFGNTNIQLDVVCDSKSSDAVMRYMNGGHVEGTVAVAYERGTVIVNENRMAVFDLEGNIIAYQDDPSNEREYLREQRGETLYCVSDSVLCEGRTIRRVK